MNLAHMITEKQAVVRPAPRRRRQTAPRRPGGRRVWRLHFREAEATGQQSLPFDGGAA